MRTQPAVHRVGRRVALGAAVVVLAVPSAFSAAGATARATSKPVVSIRPASLREGNAGVSPLRFTVSLSTASRTAVSVKYITIPGTALPSSDYVPISAIVSIPPGHLTASATVDVIGDVTFEQNETFRVLLFAASGATLSAKGRSAIGTIIDDDAAPARALSWGDNAAGALGQPTVPGGRVPTPRQVGTNASWSAVSTSDGFTLAIRKGGTLWAWGNNRRGQLGDGSTANRDTPVQIGRSTAWKSAVACGEASRSTSGQQDFSLALQSDGSIWSWGDNSAGQLGDGGLAGRFVPKRIGASVDWVSIACGNGSAFATKRDGTLWAWGSNQSGQLGDGTTRSTSAPEQIGQAQWSEISVGGSSGASYTLGVQSDGSLWAWGDNQGYELGDGTTEPHSSPEHIQPELGVHWTSVAAGFGVLTSATPPYSSYALAITSTGALWAWGDNTHGQLGDGDTDTFPTPQVTGADTDWATVSTGSFGVADPTPCSFAIKTDGSLWGWGSDAAGQLGDGSAADQDSPVPISSNAKWIALASGPQGSVGIQQDGTLWTWGNSSGGSLGLGPFDISTSAVSVATNGPWRSIAVGYHFDAAFAVAIKSDGTLWAWGSNESGELGNNTTTNAFLPTQVGTDADWASVSAGGSHVAAIRTDGTLWAWGSNQFHQLGDGTTTNRLTPEQIGSARDWQSVSAGADHTLAIKTNGTLWAWGNNQYFQLGDRTTNVGKQPKQIGKAIWSSVTAGNEQSYGIQKDGTLWAWGQPLLGTGLVNSESIPTLIDASVKNWKAVSAPLAQSSEGAMAVRTDGTLWGWGSNQHGQLGDGTTTAHTEPEQIGTGRLWDAVATSGFHTVALRGDHTLWAWGDGSAGELGDGTTRDEKLPHRIGTDETWVTIAAAGRDTLALAN